MSGKRIEIIAIGRERIYSVGAVIIFPSGDVYHSQKIRGSDSHLSRHSSGETHWKSTKQKLLLKMYKGKPISEFRGIEFLSTEGFGLNSLPELYSEYKMKKCNGIFSVDMREYQEGAFNMIVAILTAEALPSILTQTQPLKKRQIYIFPDSNPILAIIAGEAETD